ncbi:MAG: hypothetical protein RL277_653 [Planctomycetota bacterium]
MKSIFPFLIAFFLLPLGACRSAARPSADSADAGAASAAPSAAPGGDREVEGCLAMTDTRLERKPAGTQLEFQLSNTCSGKLDAEVCVQCFDASGAPLAAGRTQWVAISLAAGARRALRFEGLPKLTESWTLIARKR